MPNPFLFLHFVSYSMLTHVYSWMVNRCFMRLCFITFFVLAFAERVGAQLEDVSEEYVLTTDHTGGFLGTGVSFADFNGDGKDDLSFSHFEGELVFYESNGVTFTPVDLDLNLPTNEAKAILWVDVDNDGYRDLFVTYRLAPNQLWLNEGDGTFSNVSMNCGIAQDNRRSYGACFGDYDNDGLLDLFVANYSVDADFPPGNELYHNVGGGFFEEVTVQEGMGGSNPQSFQGHWMDVNADGLLDLHVIRDRPFFSNICYLNQGSGTSPRFVDSAEELGMDVGINAMSSAASDYDGDGDLDVYVSGGVEGNVLLENDGDGFFGELDSDALDVNQICWAATWFDLDCDGREELHVATGISNYSNYPVVLETYNDEPDRLFWNNESGFLEDVEFSNLESQLSFAVALGDINSDGFPDLVSNRIGLTAQVLEGVDNGNRWFKVRPIGTVSNIDGIGAIIDLWIEGERQTRHVHCGEGYLSQHSSWELFGTSEYEFIDSLQVRWPSGLVDHYFDLTTNSVLWVTEGETIDSCLLIDMCEGCTYSTACNYVEAAIEDDGSCDFSCWFNANLCGQGTIWDAVSMTCVEYCPADIDDSGSTNVSDLLLLLASFSTSCEQ